jgi:hypothetical protein
MDEGLVSIVFSAPSWDRLFCSGLLEVAATDFND